MERQMLCTPNRPSTISKGVLDHVADLLARPSGDSMSGCCLKAWGSQSVCEFSEPRETQAVHAVGAPCCENDAA